MLAKEIYDRIFVRSGDRQKGRALTACREMILFFRAWRSEATEKAEVFSWLSLDSMV